MGKYAFTYNELTPEHVATGIERRIVKTEKLMMVNVEFTDGPCNLPDQQHHHPHEQVSYIAEGEVFLFVDNNEHVHLKPGDCFAIPPNVPHAIQRLTAFVRIIDCFTPLREDFLLNNK